MKKLLLLVLTLSLSVAQVMRAENDSNNRKHKRQSDAAAPDDRSQQSGPPRQSVQQPGRRPLPQQAQRQSVPTPRSVSGTPRSVTPVSRQPIPNGAQPESRNRTQPSNQAVTQNRNVDRNRRDSVERNGGERNFNRNSFSVAQSRVVRTSHNRNWWRNHYNTTFVLFGGGYYYWWGNYWYPAFGYSPYYNNYLYSEPIYGYNNLAPGQVIENVQLALRDQGYYPGVIDGLVGPQTRDALAAYQRDHGLIVTAAVDEPTLVTLGLA